MLYWILLIFNLTVAIVAANSYLPDLARSEWYVWPFIPISAIFFGLMALHLLLKILGRKTPQSLLVFLFIGAFSYGFISIILYPIIMHFRGMYLYYGLCLITHTVLGFEAMYILRDIKPKTIHLLPAAYFVIQDYLNIFYHISDYLDVMSPFFVNIIITGVLALQVISLAFLLKKVGH